MILSVQEMIHSMRGEWAVYCTTSPVEALELTNRIPVDVVVVDIQLPDRTGIDFLSRIQKTSSHVVKIAITDQRNVTEHLRTSGLAQQFLGKIYDKDSLKSSILRALTLGDLLRHNMLQHLISQVQTLPSLPNMYLQIADELNDPNPSAERVGQIISQDLSMSAKVLQIVNSAHFGLPYPVANPGQATTLLGLEAIRDLILSIKVFSSFDQLKIRHLGLTRLWHHSVLVGVMSKTIAKTISSDKKTNNYAFVAGLLHDIGKLVLAENLPMKYHSAMGMAAQKKIELIEAEEEVFGATHAQVGAYLLWLWNLPEPVIHATAYHHTPLEYTNRIFSPVTTVHLANAFNYEISTHSIKWSRPVVNEEYARLLGISKNLDNLRQLCNRTADSLD